MQASLGELATRFGCELVGDPATAVTHVATLANAGPQSLSFLANPAYRDELAKTRAAAVLVRPEDVDACPVAALVSRDPYLTYAQVAAVLHPPRSFPPGVHASAVVSPSAHVADSASVGPLVVICEHAAVGEGASIGPGAVVGPRCSVGRGTRIHANVTLAEDVRIGE